MGRYVLFIIILSLGLLSNHWIITANAAGKEPPPPINYGEFIVSFFEYEHGTIEYELFELVKSDLEIIGFRTQTINVDLSNPIELFNQDPNVFFIIVFAVAEEENPTYTAKVYSRSVSDPKKFLDSSQLSLSSNINQYIVKQAEIAAIAETSDSEDPVSPDFDQQSLSLSALKDYRAGNYESAVEKYNKVLEIDPNQWRIHYYLSLSYHELGDAEKEWDHIQSGLEIDPQNELLLLSKGNIFFRAENYEEAQKYYLPMIDSIENGAASRFNLSLIYEREGKYKEARKILTEPSGLKWGTLDQRVISELQKLDQIEDRLKRNIYRTISVAGIFMLIFVICVIILRNRRKSQSEVENNMRRNSQLADKNVLLQTINERMDITELRELCFVLGLDWENLSGSTKNTKSISLIEHFSNRREMEKLQDEIGKLRPDLKFVIEQ